MCFAIGFRTVGVGQNMSRLEPNLQKLKPNCMYSSATDRVSVYIHVCVCVCVCACASNNDNNNDTCIIIIIQDLVVIDVIYISIYNIDILVQDLIVIDVYVRGAAISWTGAAVYPIVQNGRHWWQDHNVGSRTRILVVSEKVRRLIQTAWCKAYILKPIIRHGALKKRH